DPASRAIVLISKPAPPEVARPILAAAAQTGKPAVAVFLGADPADYPDAGVQIVSTLTEAARQAVLAVGGRDDAAPPDQRPDDPALQRARSSLKPEQRFVRGAFCGGTLCDEALVLLGKRLGPLHSNIPLDPRFGLADPNRSQANTLVDLGADEFTLGRPHP